MEKYLTMLLPLFFSFIGTALTLHYLIPVLKSKRVGQKILDIGPRWHKDKEGTPTMGGIAFLVFITLSSVLGLVYLFLSKKIEKASFSLLLLTVFYGLANGIIGITDDVQKLRRKKNEGLTATEKYLLQLAASLVFIFLLRRFGGETAVYLPFFGEKADLGVFWYPLALLFLTGFTNAVNLTDGLDGLCGTVSTAVALFFALFLSSTGFLGGAVLSTSIIGGTLGFLVYNLHPAKVFMGDTGSLFLGALISGLALSSGNAAVLFIVGIVYLLEAASVIIQVLFFKLTGKRVFLMAPLHHHFEKKGMSEGKITLLALIITLIASVATYYSR